MDNKAGGGGEVHGTVGCQDAGQVALLHVAAREILRSAEGSILDQTQVVPENFVWGTGAGTDPDPRWTCSRRAPRAGKKVNFPDTA